MSSDFTHLNLADVEDIAPARGFGERWEARAAREALHAEQTGVMYFRLHPGKRSPSSTAIRPPRRSTSSCGATGR